jgi:hypothetical protein
MNTARREVCVSLQGSTSFQFFREFRCPSCNGQKAYRSRFRGMFEQVALFFLMLKPVRCDRCYHRRYVFWTVPALAPGGPAGKVSSHSSGNPSAGSRVA